jgi:hypothetical protein
VGVVCNFTLACFTVIAIFHIVGGYVSVPQCCHAYHTPTIYLRVPVPVGRVRRDACRWPDSDARSRRPSAEVV